MKCCNLDQGSCSRAGFPTTLLPLLKSSHRHSEQPSELRLRKPGLFTRANDGKRLSRKSPTCTASLDVTNALKYLATNIAGLFPLSQLFSSHLTHRQSTPSFVSKGSRGCL